MYILHYALGFPPYRTGGLTKFCCDLMAQQQQMGHQVALLWPGRMGAGGCRVHPDGYVQNIASFELINPLPVSYDEGIVQPEAFMGKEQIEPFEKVLQGVQVLHIHTLMGLPKGLVLAAKQKKITLVFTTHDFFPICPKVTMFRGAQVCPTAADCTCCTTCNASALPMWKMRLLQSGIYRKLKDSVLVKKLRRGHRAEYFSQNAQQDDLPAGDGQAYLSLRSYYKEILEQMDCIHYNSDLTRKVYLRYLGTQEGAVIPVSHADIGDNRKPRDFSDAPLRITYLGQPSGAKGWFVLKTALDHLYQEGKSFVANIFFQPEVDAPYLQVGQRYTYEDLPKIFENTDILVAPSVWYETFGYTVLEAVSYGVPVAVSTHVGAADILPEGAAVVVDAGSAQALAQALSGLTREKLAQMHQATYEAKIWSMADVAQMLERTCYRGEKENG